MLINLQYFFKKINKYSEVYGSSIFLCILKFAMTEEPFKNIVANQRPIDLPYLATFA